MGIGLDACLFLPLKSCKSLRIWMILVCSDRKVKGCPYILSWLNSNPSAKTLADLLANPQAKSIAVVIQVPTLNGTWTPTQFEDVFYFSLRHSYSLIYDSDIYRDLIFTQNVRCDRMFHKNLACSLKLDSVCEQIQQDLLHPPLVKVQHALITVIWNELDVQVQVLNCPPHHLNYLKQSIWNWCVNVSWSKVTTLKDSVIEEIICVE